MVRRNLTRGRSFDGVAEGYDRFRPRYPSALFDDLGEAVGLDEHSRILEVGCGPGVATESMMARGWSVLAVDPGAQLARVAREKFAAERFAVEVATFDEWDPRGRRFDLLFSAAAYHWVAPEVRWVKAAEVVDDGGYLALAGNRAVARGSFHEFYEATARLREEYGVDEERPSPTPDELGDIVTAHAHDVGSLWEAVSPQGSDIVAGDLFGAPDVHLYPWSRSYSTAEALGLLATYSRFVVMDGARRDELFARMAALADERFAGELIRHYVCVTALAPRSSS
ncbi:MAG: class I SAM-dependent methyltransferase [Acidobacteriota bacterium]|nr:class I SAM-dependent methyltransferase [Acidobacteriota bacterium]